MRKFLTILSTAIISFGLGFLFALPAPRSEGAPPAPSADIPAAAQRMWFPPVDQYDTGGEPLSDESFDELMAAFDVAMTAEETLADFDREASVHLWSFARRLAIPEVTDEQRERISSYMDALIEQHPDGRATIEERVSLIDAYSASMPSAPGFAGSLLLFGDADEYDVDGEPFDDDLVVHGCADRAASGRPRHDRRARQPHRRLLGFDAVGSRVRRLPPAVRRRRRVRCRRRTFRRRPGGSIDRDARCPARPPRGGRGPGGGGPIRLPKVLLRKYGWSKSLILEESDNGIILHGNAERRQSWEDTYRAMAADREDWSDFNVTLADGLDSDLG